MSAQAQPAEGRRSQVAYMKSQAVGVATPRIPPAALSIIGALVLAALLAAGAARLSTPDEATVAEAAESRRAPVLAQRRLHFDDQADGSILVTDAGTGATVERIGNGSDAFIRSAVRGLVRERKRQGIGATAPFELTARQDGSLTLLDPATGRRIELQAFGRSNAGAFARLLQPTTRSTTTP